jgi:hypothetical protein
MNIVFLSPHFPPNYYHFCVQLRARGATVLGLADQPYESLRPELRGALSEYYMVGDLHRYDEVLRALGYFTHCYGKIDRIDSLNEHWLESEARLRTDFNISGPKIADLPSIKRKSVMKQRFITAGLAVAPGIVADDAQAVRNFVAEMGLPVVAKPDSGVGANETYKITNAAELEAFLALQRSDYFVEAFVQGVIVTYDGLTDREGAPIFATSMQYSQGVMDVVNLDGDVYYYTQRNIPPDIEQVGRALLKAFGVTERFFHFEFFRTPEGGLIALEVNMRPPGGLSLDMFNYGSNIDLYGIWAELLVHGTCDLVGPAPYHVCYVGRKYGKHYSHTHEEILANYGPLIIHHQPMATVFRRAMGDYGYLVRTMELDEVIGAATFMQELRLV